MYAVIETGGKQLKVEAGQEIYVEKLDAEAGDEVVFDKVCLISNEGTKIGTPYVDGAKVTAKVEKQGKEKKVKQNVNVAGENWDGSDYGPYAKVFDDTHSDWKQDPEMNLFYLRARQAQANDMLKSQGHLFLNEVYDMLGFKRTKAGAVVGWIYDDKKPYGDNFVDFGMTEIRRHDADSDEYKRAFILDFNVVGDITSKIVDHQNDYLA